VSWIYWIKTNAATNFGMFAASLLPRIWRLPMNNFDHEFQVALDSRFRILDRDKYKETRMASVVRMGICLILIAVCGIVGADDTKPDMSQWSSTVVTENGQLAVEGIQLVNPKGDPVVLRGVSFTTRGRSIGW
jgi:hypothetical protein